MNCVENLFPFDGKVAIVTEVARRNGKTTAEIASQETKGK